MKFEEILPHLRAGKRARRKHWTGTGISTEHQDLREVDVDDLLYDDWELVPEAPKTAGEALYAAQGGNNWISEVPGFKKSREEFAQAVIAWHESRRLAQDGHTDDAKSMQARVNEYTKSSAPEVAAEPKSLGQIAWEAHGGLLPWMDLTKRYRRCWDSTAQAVRAEVLKEAHRELTTHELWSCMDGAVLSAGECDEDFRRFLRKADERRAKR